MKMISIALIVLAMLSLPACSTKRGTGTLVGAGVGAAAGYAIGKHNNHGTKGAAIGAAAGAAGGYIIGNEMDKSDEEDAKAAEQPR